MNKRKEGITMIIILWTVTILTVLTTVTVLMTTSDITSTVNLVSRHRTIKSAESCSEFIISYLPEYKDLGYDIDTVVNDTFIEEGDTIYAHSLCLKQDSSDMCSITSLPIVKTGASTYDPTAVSQNVNPIFYDNKSLFLEYKTRGLIKKDDGYIAQRKIGIAATFTYPSAGTAGGMGHTMY